MTNGHSPIASFMDKASEEAEALLLKQQERPFMHHAITIDEREIKDMYIRTFYYKELLIHIQSLFGRQLASIKPIYDTNGICMTPDAYTKAFELIKGSQNGRK